MTTSTSSQATVPYEALKLCIDAHARYYWVSRQVDGAPPQPVQNMTCDELMLFVVEQQKLTSKVVACYEAGAFGFHLHPRFEELGIKNYVVQPRAWDERGNKKAFNPVRIPSVDEERKRAMSRQRQQFMRERQRFAGFGRNPFIGRGISPLIDIQFGCYSTAKFIGN